MKFLFLLSSLISSISFATINISIDKSASSAEFLAIGSPSALKIRGKNGKPDGKLTVEGTSFKGEVSLNLSQFETGMKLRDKHMSEKYLEVEKSDFKNAKLKIVSTTLPENFWQSPAKQKGSFKGLLKLHGTEKEVSGSFDINDSSPSSLTGTAKFSISLLDYNIAIPSFAGITVAQNVDIDINFKGNIEK